jgi:hypothetical protein
MMNTKPFVFRTTACAGIPTQASPMPTIAGAGQVIELKK